MRVVFTGTRSFKNPQILNDALNAFQPKFGMITHVVVGGAKEGFDKLVFDWAMRSEIPCSVFPAKWKTGKGSVKAQGPIRNRAMIQFALELKVAHCIAAWDGQSPGTEDTFTLAEKAGMGVMIKKVGGQHEGVTFIAGHTVSSVEQGNLFGAPHADQAHPSGESI